MANELEKPVMAATIPATIGWTMGYRTLSSGDANEVRAPGAPVGEQPDRQNRLAYADFS
jgi:hypothetical protein